MIGGGGGQDRSQVVGVDGVRGGKRREGIEGELGPGRYRVEKFPTFLVPQDRVTGLPKWEKIAGNDGYDRKLAEPLTWARVRGGNEEGNIEEKPGRWVPRGVISCGIVAPQVPT